MKNKTKYKIVKWIVNILFISLFVIAIALLLMVMSVSDKSRKDRIECLEPLAEQICEERGLYYSSINSYNSIFCKGDERRDESIRLRFTPEEIEVCSQTSEEVNK